MSCGCKLKGTQNPKLRSNPILISRISGTSKQTGVPRDEDLRDTSRLSGVPRTAGTARLSGVPRTSNLYDTTRLSGVPRTSNLYDTSRLSGVPRTSNTYDTSRLSGVPRTGGLYSTARLSGVPRTGGLYSTARLSGVPRTEDVYNTPSTNLSNIQKNNSSNKMDYLEVAQFNERTTPKTLLNYEDTFDEKKVLGKGGFGEVYLVEGPEGQQYALKVLLVTDPKTLKEETGSISVLSRAPQCNKDIVCFYDSFQFKKNGKIVYGILSQYIDGYDLDKAIENNVTLTEEMIYYIGMWLLYTVADLHKNNFVHRDLKPGNIMWDNDKGFVTLIDFGLSCVRPGSKGVKGASICLGGKAGTPAYMPPELINAKSSELASDAEYMMDVYKGYDVYAIGASLYELLDEHINGNKYSSPYDLDSNGIPLNYTYHPLENVDDEWNFVLERLVDPDPSERPDIWEAIKLMESLGQYNEWEY